MAGKKEFSAAVVKAFRSFSQIFSVADGESGQSCGILELEGHRYGAGPEFWAQLAEVSRAGGIDLVQEFGLRPALCLRIPINRVDGNQCEVEGAGLKIRDGGLSNESIVGRDRSGCHPGSAPLPAAT